MSRMLALWLCWCGAVLADAPLPATPLEGSRQLVVVVTDGWDSDHGVLSLWQRSTGAGWSRTHAPVAVTVGRKGSAWGLGLHGTQPGVQKREGDGRSPAGVFAIGPSFGAAPAFDTRLPYQHMDAGDWCIDVPASPLYNRIVDVAEVGEAAIEGSTEPMRRDLHADGDQRYSRGLVVQHNVGASSGAGSCIFVHVWGAPGQPTAGCTAMDGAALDRLLAALDPSLSPRFVLLPLSEYRRLAAEWQLPPSQD